VKASSRWSRPSSHEVSWSSLLFDHLDCARPPLFRPILLGVEQVDRGQILDMGLDRIEGREHPHAGAGAGPRIGGHQRPATLGDVHHDRARFEQLQPGVAIALLIGRHLAERLQPSIGGGRLILGPDQAFLVGETRLLERPAHAQIAHQPLSEGGTQRNALTLIVVIPSSSHSVSRRPPLTGLAGG